jgi:spermidine synthase
VSKGFRQTFLHYFVFFAFGLSGTAALIYEVVWTRKLSLIMGSSTYALSTMLAAFMTGLALGGTLGGVLVPKLQRHLRAFALCEVGIGLSALLTIPLITALTPLFMKIYFVFHSSFRAFSIVQFCVVFVIILVPTTLMGMTLPLVIKHFDDGRSEIAARAGYLYAFNTFGAVIGSMGAGFVLIPLLGVSDATLMAALLNLTGGLVILTFSEIDQRRFALIPVMLMGAIILRLLDPPYVPFISYYSAHRFGNYDVVSSVQKSIREIGAHNVVLFHHEGVESDVTLMREFADEGLVLSNNGKLEGGARSTGFVLLAHLPYFSLEPNDPPVNALNIGLGSGVTLSYLAEFPLHHIDSVELSKGIVEANRRFLSSDLFLNPRIQHVIADGRNYLLLQERKQYDIIVVSPSWAVELASAGLLTDEFFQLASKRLTPRGKITIYLDLFYAPSESIDIIFRTFRRSFPHAMAWTTVDGEMILVGSLSPFQRSAQEIGESIVRHTPHLLEQFRVARSGKEFEQLGEGPINSDDRPIIEFHNARYLITGLDPL